MTSSPVETAAARPGGADRVPGPRAGAVGPTAAAVRHGAMPRVGEMPRQAVVEAAALVGRLTAAGGGTGQAAREGMHPVEGVTAVPGRPVRRRNEGVPA